LQALEVSPETLDVTECRGEEEMKEIYFIVEGRVQPKQRPRVFRNKYTGKVQTITPQETVDYENKVKASFWEACDGEDFFLTGAVQMTVNVYVEIAKSTPKKTREKMLAGEIKPITRTGDLDNLFKAISDALNKVAYDDDSQIIEATIRKFYGERARAEITIREVEDE
jgi:Holliday junction resolvase RusA-like endonuclease